LVVYEFELLTGASSVIDEKLKKKVGATLKSLDKARRAVRALANAKEPILSKALLLVEKAIEALRAVSLDDLLESLDQQSTELKQLGDRALARRREELLRSAKAAGWQARRMQDYDHVDCFRVNYNGARVTLQLGSEIWGAFDEADGHKAFVRIQEARSSLEEFPFGRDEFFSMVKDAVRLAKLQGFDRDGKVSIRKLYALLVLVRQSRDKAFMKQPSTRSFREYSVCQFIYDLARFGKKGWSVRDGERLHSQTPNMATISKGESVTLPTLGEAGHGTQLALLWIEKG
jgi:hypothetical protein